jgi:hypothetical protein
VAEAVRYSEEGATKCIGLTIETRPDYCLTPHLTDMLSYGCTRLEIGLQSIYEDVARDTNRGHTVAAVQECFCLAKDAGFKVGWCCPSFRGGGGAPGGCFGGRAVVDRGWTGKGAVSIHPIQYGSLMCPPSSPITYTSTAHDPFPDPVPPPPLFVAPGGVPHDAGPAQCGLGARPGVLQGIL